MFTYQSQESQQTLSEGLAEYYLENQKFFRTRDVTAEAADFFRCHDVVHVVFGCDISLEQELTVKIASMLGTTAGIGILKGYRLAESVEIYEQLKASEIIRVIGKSFLLVPKTTWRCTRMSKRWNWDDFDDYLTMPLNKLRREFGITVD